MRIWIFHFGSATLTYDQDWKDLITRLNTVNVDWTRVLGWHLSRLLRYEIHFPCKANSLLAIDSIDLSAFNAWSTVCDSGSCDFKTECCSTPQFSTSLCCET